GLAALAGAAFLAAARVAGLAGSVFLAAGFAAEAFVGAAFGGAAFLAAGLAAATSPGPAWAELSAFIRRDLRRAALLAWRMPLLAARSRLAIAARPSSAAFSACSATARRTRTTRVLIADRVDLLRSVRPTLARICLRADAVRLATRQPPGWGIHRYGIIANRSRCPCSSSPASARRCTR